MDANTAADAAAAAVASKVTYGSAGLTGFGWLFSNEFAVFAGIVIGLLGFLVNWYYRHRADTRLAREHEARMERLRKGRTIPDEAEDAQ